jgi:hypothetical protein
MPLVIAPPEILVAEAIPAPENEPAGLNVPRLGVRGQA